MPEDAVSLDELLESRVAGYWGSGQATDTATERVDVVRAGDITPAGLLTGSAPRWLRPKEKAKALCRPGDVLITASGNGLGKAWLCPNGIEVAASNFTRRLRCNPDRALGAFVRLAIQSPIGARKLVEHTATSAFPNLKPSFFSDPWVPRLPLGAQRWIVGLIARLDAHEAALDDEVDKIRQVLRAACEAEWQLDAKASVSQLGPIVTGATPRTGVEEFWHSADVDFVTPGDVGELGWIATSGRRTSHAGAMSVRMVPAFSVGVVCIGATIGKVGLTKHECVTNQQINSVVGMSADDSVYLAAVLAAPSGQAILIGSAGRTAIPLVSKTSFGRLAVPWPAGERRSGVAQTVRGLLGVRDALKVEQCSSSQLRRVVLGGLLSGSLPIPGSYDGFLEPA